METCMLSIRGRIYFFTSSCRVLRVLYSCILMIKSSFLTISTPPVSCCLLTAARNIFLVLLMIWRTGLHSHIPSSSLIQSSNLRTEESTSMCNLKAQLMPFFNFSYWNALMASSTLAKSAPILDSWYLLSLNPPFHWSPLVFNSGLLYTSFSRSDNLFESASLYLSSIWDRRDLTVLPDCSDCIQLCWYYQLLIIYRVTSQKEGPQKVTPFLFIINTHLYNFSRFQSPASICGLMSRTNLTGKIMFNRYLVGSCIGFGSFGEVYLVYDTQAQEIFAMKVEEDRIKNPLLAHQAKIIKALTGQKGFVSFQHYGYENKFNVVVMGLLGPSLEDLFNACNRSFTLKTILMLAEQILNRIETFHSKNFVYRDIKPENLLMGLHQKSHIVHLVDFGLSKKYRDSKNHQHIPYKENRSLTGTVRYSSINTHLDLEYSRRDDLESIGYMLQYFYKGCLPWQGLHANTNAEKYNKILQYKQTIPIEVQFIDMPIQFSTYMHYVRTLKFADRPDYSFVRRLFTDLMEKLGYEKDYVYDWCLLKHSVKLENQTMSLGIRNRYCDLESPYVTFSTEEQAEQIKQQEIQLNIETEEANDSSFSGNMQNSEMEDSNEGNIDPHVLEDSDLKLISHRNKWYEIQL